MKGLICGLCLLCVVAFSSVAKAGPFSLDNLSSMNAGAFDVAPETPKSTARDARVEELEKKLADLSKQLTTANVNRTKAALNRPQAAASDLDLNAALRQTTGQCANGQCGRN